MNEVASSNGSKWAIRLGLSSLGLIVAILLGPGGPGRAEAALPGGNGSIAFARLDNSRYNIYATSPDSSNPTALTTSPDDDYHPSFSPDGSRIAFISARDGNAEVYVMDADGSHQTRLTNTFASESNPAFSPDGRRIAFASDRDGNSNIYVMNTDGSDQTRLTNDPAWDDQPAFSRDGSIAFRSLRDGPAGIYVSDSSGERRLTDTTTSAAFPDFAPDGHSVVYTSFDANGSEIYTVGVDGSNPTRLTNNTATDLDPAFSPDGRKITFMSERDRDREIYVMDADGANQGRLTRHPGEDNFPTWGVGNSIADRDVDGVEDDADNCPGTPNSSQDDLDGDGLGDACDADRDGDGTQNASDNCADTPNPDQSDFDSDGQGDACDPDSPPAARLHALSASVDRLDLQAGINRSLTGKLETALKQLNSGRRRAACGSLGAFSHEVRAQAGKKIPRPDAESLLDEAARIQRAIGC